MMLSHKGDTSNQVCEIHTKFKSQVIKVMCIACLLFGILPLGGDFYLHLINVCCPTLGKLTRILAPWSNPHHLPAFPPPPGLTLIADKSHMQTCSLNLNS